MKHEGSYLVRILHLAGRRRTPLLPDASCHQIRRRRNRRLRESSIEVDKRKEHVLFSLTLLITAAAASVPTATAPVPTSLLISAATTTIASCVLSVSGTRVDLVVHTATSTEAAASTTWGSLRGLVDTDLAAVESAGSCQYGGW